MQSKRLWKNKIAPNERYTAEKSTILSVESGILFRAVFYACILSAAFCFISVQHAMAQETSQKTTEQALKKQQAAKKKTGIDSIAVQTFPQGKATPNTLAGSNSDTASNTSGLKPIIYPVETIGLDITVPEYVYMGRTYQEIYDFYAALNPVAYNKSYAAYVMKLLSAKIPADKSIKTGRPLKYSATALLDIRIEKLLQAGKLRTVRNLLLQAEKISKNSRYDEIIVKSYLAVNEMEPACNRVNQNSELKTEFWMLAKLVCVSMAGDAKKVTTVLKEINTADIDIPDGLEELVLYQVEKSDLSTDTQVSLNLWTAVVMNAVSVGIPLNEIPESIYIQKNIILNESIDAMERIALSEKMFAKGMIDVNTLYAVYNSLPVEYAVTVTKDKQGNDYIPESYSRATAYKSMVWINNPEVLVSAYKILLKKMSSDFDKIIVVRAFSPFFNKISSNNTKNRLFIIQSLLGGGDNTSIDKWLRKHRKIAWFERNIFAIKPAEKSNNYSDMKTPVVLQNVAKNLMKPIDLAKYFEKNPTRKIADIKNQDMTQNPQNILARHVKQWAETLVADDMQYAQSYVQYGLMILKNFDRKIPIETWQASVINPTEKGKKTGYNFSENPRFDEKNTLKILQENMYHPTDALLVLQSYMEKSRIPLVVLSDIVGIYNGVGLQELAKNIILEQWVLQGWHD